MRGAEQGLGEEGGVDETLVAVGEVHVVVAGGVDRVMNAAAGESDVVFAELAFGSGVGAELKPGSHAVEETADGFEVGEFGAVLSAFDWHEVVEMIFGEGRQNGVGEAAEDADGVGAVEGAVVVGAGEVVLGLECRREEKRQGDESDDGAGHGRQRITDR